MKIAMIGGLSGSDGGVERFTRKLTNRLNEKGFEIDLYEFKANTDNPVISPLSFYSQIMADFNEKKSYQIVHSHSFYPVGLIVMKKLGSKYVTTAHYSYLEYTKAMDLSYIKKLGAYFVGQAYEKTNFNIAKKIISVSNYLKKSIENYYGVESRKITVINPGIDYEKIRKMITSKKPHPTKERIFYIGRLFRQKGVDILIRAIHLLRNKNIELLVGGEGKELESLRALVSQLQLTNVKFLGFLKEDEKIKLMNSCDIVVFPSFYEAFPAVALEAMACDAAIVASDIAPYKEALGKAAVYFKVGDVQDLATKVRKVLADKKLQKELRSRSKERAPAYKFSNVVDKYARFYDNFANTKD